jgi:UPF0755 protein
MAALGSGVLMIGWRVFLNFVGQPSEVTVSARTVVVTPGATNESLVSLLKQEQLVTKSFLLELYLTKFRKPAPFEPGEYELSGLMTPAEIVDQIQSGKVVTYALAIEPGQSTSEIARTLSDKGFGVADAIQAAALDAQFAESLKISGKRLEGYLFPDTYDLPRKLSPKNLLKILVQRFREKVDASVINEAKNAGLNLHELVVLASLIASDDIPPEELRMVSSVYHNRLKANKKLEHAQSLAYGLGKSVGKLTLSDRRIENDWKTFMNKGLPQTPITSPGMNAIIAAARPAKSDALYFAPRTETSHIFCPDAECHAIAMRRWREAQKDKKRSAVRR